MTNNMFEVNVNRSYDVINQEWNNEIFLKLYVSAFTSGLVKELGSERFVTLLAIASFMDENGECYPTQETIAERVGVSRRTVGKYINDLLDFRWNDKPLITRTKRRNPKISPNEYSVYTVLPLSQVAIFNGQVEAMGNAMGNAMGTDLPTNKNKQDLTISNINKLPNEQSEESSHAVELSKTENPKQAVNYWRSKYRETYGVNCNVVWGRDLGMMKKLFSVYTTSQIEQIINIIFQEYDKRWANNQFPRPTIGQLATWLADKALAVVEEVEKEQQAVKKAQEIAEQMTEVDEDELLKKFGGA